MDTTHACVVCGASAANIATEVDVSDYASVTSSYCSEHFVRPAEAIREYCVRWSDVEKLKVLIVEVGRTGIPPTVAAVRSLYPPLDIQRFEQSESLTDKVAYLQLLCDAMAEFLNQVEGELRG